MREKLTPTLARKSVAAAALARKLESAKAPARRPSCACAAAPRPWICSTEGKRRRNRSGKKMEMVGRKRPDRRSRVSRTGSDERKRRPSVRVSSAFQHFGNNADLFHGLEMFLFSLLINIDKKNSIFADVSPYLMLMKLS
jgi:hypothetical protein